MGTSLARPLGARSADEGPDDDMAMTIGTAVVVNYPDGATSLDVVDGRKVSGSIVLRSGRVVPRRWCAPLTVRGVFEETRRP